jgi:hypothetical protein
MAGDGNIPSVVIHQQCSPDKLINVIIFYRHYEIRGNSAIGDALVFVIKYFIPPAETSS